jgi:hypothetical protein
MNESWSPPFFCPRRSAQIADDDRADRPGNEVTMAMMAGGTVLLGSTNAQNPR